MATCSEISVTVKNSERRLVQKFLIYDTYTIDENDPIISNCIKQTIDNFDSDDYDDVRVKINLEIK